VCEIYSKGDTTPCVVPNRLPGSPTTIREASGGR